MKGLSKQRDGLKMQRGVAGRGNDESGMAKGGVQTGCNVVGRDTKRVSGTEQSSALHAKNSHQDSLRPSEKRAV